MIVPRPRLLFWFALIVLPFALVGAAEPSAMALSLGAISALLVLTLVDAIMARQALAGITVELPEIARMSKDRSARLEVRIRNPRQQPRTLRLALVLPPEVRSGQEEAWITLPRDSEWSRLAWACVPLRRGTYSLRSACVETSSPLGFWSLRRTLPVQSELRVYPNLLDARRSLAALFLRRGAFGLHAHRQVGKGREFEKLREYIPGDTYDDIHWKTTAKRGRPVTKVFQLERTQEVYVIIDASRLAARPSSPSSCSSGRQSALTLDPEPPNQLLPSAVTAPANGTHAFALADTAPSTHFDQFITAALTLGLAAEQQGDCFGLLTFSDKVEKFVRARNGKAHYRACRDALYALEPRVVTPDYDEVCTFLRLRLRRRALLIFLTVLDDPLLAESFTRNLDLICRQHLVLVNMPQPPGVGPVFEDPNLNSVDELYQRLGGHLRWQNLRELERVLHRRGVQFSLLKNERLTTELVSQYLNVKRRQML